MRFNDVVAERFRRRSVWGRQIESDMVANPIGGSWKMAGRRPYLLTLRATGGRSTRVILQKHRCITIRCPQRQPVRWGREGAARLLEDSVDGSEIRQRLGVWLRACVDGSGSLTCRRRVHAMVKSRAARVLADGAALRDCTCLYPSPRRRHSKCAVRGIHTAEARVQGLSVPPRP